MSETDPETRASPGGGAFPNEYAALQAEAADPVTSSAEVSAAQSPEAEPHPSGLLPAPTLLRYEAGRSATFHYNPSETANVDTRAGTEQVEMTEAQGVERLTAFLDNYIAQVGPDADAENQALAQQAKNIRENLTFIDEARLEHAAAARADRWKAYLDDDPDNHLYLWSKPHKSSSYLVDQALGHFSDEELASYQGRIAPATAITRRDERGTLPPVPDKYKIVMVEDWIASGRQIADAYFNEIGYPLQDNGIEEPNIELDLVAATPAQVQDGLRRGDGISDVHMPIVATYEANPAESGEPLITGIHSSTDDLFEIPIGDMVKQLRTTYHQPEAVMPPLTNIVRPYRDSEYEPVNIARLEQHRP